MGAPDALNASNGQSCYWFSNGCTVGCDKCDGTTSHVGHGRQAFLYKGMNASYVQKNNITIPNPFNPAPGVMVLDPKSKAGISIKPGCAKTNGQKATICASSLRTINTQAECGSNDDIYFFRLIIQLLVLQYNKNVQWQLWCAFLLPCLHAMYTKICNTQFKQCPHDAYIARGDTLGPHQSSIHAAARGVASRANR